MSECVDLRDFGDRYRVWNELEGRRAYGRDDPWHLTLPGWSGFVAPHGGVKLVARTRSRGMTRRLLAVVPGAQVVQDGDDGQNVTFDASHLGLVADLLRLRRRRHLTDAQRQALGERVARFRFSPGHAVQRDPETRQALRAAQGDQGPSGGDLTPPHAILAALPGMGR
jgi:hypothetical protein